MQLVYVDKWSNSAHLVSKLVATVYRITWPTSVLVTLPFGIT